MFERLKAKLPWRRKRARALNSRTINYTAGGLAPVASISTRMDEGGDSRLDWGLLAGILLLVGFGLVMVYSASIPLHDRPRNPTPETYYLWRQAISIGVGIVLMSVVYRVPTVVWQRFSIVLLIVATALLILVLAPGIGRVVNNARRWIPVAGFNVQPSEIMKLAAVLCVSYFSANQLQYMHSFIRGFLPVALGVVVVAFLLYMEPDFGSVIVVTAISMGILFLAGVSMRNFCGVAGIVLAGFVAIIWFSPMRRARLFAYLDPWNPENVLGKSYQLTHSLIAFGRGEWTGVGLGGSIEKLQYLPEAHTDFIMAVVGEELGFVGVVCVLTLFYWMIRRIFVIGRKAVKLDRIFSGLVAQGVGVWIAIQVIINVGMATGALPTKGLTLPLVSYGGSAMVVMLVALGIVLRIDRENKTLMKGGA